MRSHSLALRVSAAMLALCSLLRWNLGVTFLAGLVLGLPGRERGRGRGEGREARVGRRRRDGREERKGGRGARVGGRGGRG